MVRFPRAAIYSGRLFAPNDQDWERIEQDGNIALQEQSREYIVKLVKTWTMWKMFDSVGIDIRDMNDEINKLDHAIKWLCRLEFSADQNNKAAKHVVDEINAALNSEEFQHQNFSAFISVMEGVEDSLRKQVAYVQPDGGGRPLTLDASLLRTLAAVYAEVGGKVSISRNTKTGIYTSPFLRFVCSINRCLPDWQRLDEDYMPSRVVEVVRWWRRLPERGKPRPEFLVPPFSRTAE